MGPNLKRHDQSAQSKCCVCSFSLFVIKQSKQCYPTEPNKPYTYTYVHTVTTEMKQLLTHTHSYQTKASSYTHRIWTRTLNTKYNFDE